jgi:nucleoside-diphosphate-sugar epimerase
MHKHIIIGLGWLGSPLAMHFLNAGLPVSGTTRNSEKAQLLATKGIQTLLFDLYKNDITAIPRDIFQDANVIINIPPGRKGFEPTLFIERMKSLFNYILLHHAHHICFISTTSVFGGLEGRISNDSALVPNTPSGNAHVELELYLKDIALASAAKPQGDAIKASLIPAQDTELTGAIGFSCSVLRLAGLVGKDRHPITTLSQKSNIALGSNPVNLVHRQDVIQVICAILQVAQRKKHNRDPLEITNSQLESNFYAANLCSLEHPTREEYYTWCAQQKGIRNPQFTPDTRKIITGKWIDAEQTISQLRVKLHYPSPYSMLE